MSDEWERIGKYSYRELLSRHLLGWTEKDHEKHDTQSQGLESEPGATLILRRSINRMTQTVDQDYCDFHVTLNVERDKLEDIDVYGRIILAWILESSVGTV